MTGNTGWMLLAFIAYMIIMIVIGAVYSKKTSNAQDYFLGGRGLGAWVAALSAQASDMSGWLLMGLPGAIYIAGTGEAWIAVGLFVGTLLNWLIISGRLRRYTIKAGNSFTLPSFFENRYHDKSKILIAISSIFIVIFFLVYTASAFSAGAKLFNTVFGLDYHVALVIGAAVILTYTFLGGFLAVCLTDFIQGMLMLVGLLAVPIIALAFIDPGSLQDVLMLEGFKGGTETFLNPAYNGGEPISAMSIISNLGWGLGYFGMPHILVRFMAIKSQKELNKSKIIANVWVFISLGMAVVVGIVGKAYMYSHSIDLPDSENVFIKMIKNLFTVDMALPVIGGIFLCGILAAIMSTADSQLLVTASAVSEDIYRGILKKSASEKATLRVGKIAVVVVAIVAFIIAWNPDSSVMALVSDAWAGFGATFGPVIILALFWRRSTRNGAIAGMIGGGLMVIIWDYIPLVGGQTPGTATGLYSLVIGFAVGLVANIIVSLISKKPDAEVLADFDAVADKNVDIESVYEKLHVEK